MATKVYKQILLMVYEIVFIHVKLLFNFCV